jgi:peptidoglycan/LPS O-acetylase OafA/YrhL
VVALDGLRAVALCIIMGYHFGVGRFQGGFFSLDIFYVLSGYLITGLLLGEWARAARITLSAFWLRRARRLLPALAVMVVVVTLVVRFTYPAGLYPDLRMADLSALFYFSNWWQIVASGNYFFATGAVSPLTHTWSLAVEEQFYLVWPLVVVAVLHVGRRFDRGIEVLLGISVVGTVASAAEMAYLYHPGMNTTRLYFGTDTHAQSILVGSALACVLTLVQRHRGREGMAPVATTTRNRVLLTAVGLAGLAGTVVLTATLSGESTFAYRGGFLCSALSAAALITGAVCVARGPIANALSLRPLVWMGTVSYGAYLWHFPVSLELDSARTGTSGVTLLGLRVAATFTLAALSYYLVERPVMEGVFWRSLKAAGPAIACLGATVVVVVAGTVVPASASVAVRRFRPSTPMVRPPVVVVLGDSTALTLGYALAATAPAGTRVVDGGLFGCGLAIASWASNDPPTPQLAMFPPCNESTPAAGQWPAEDAARMVGTGRGDLVLFVAGTWEVQDLLQEGRWTNITEPSFQSYELGQLRRLVGIGSAHGAHVDLATMPAAGPASDSAEASRADVARRRMIYDHLLGVVAAEFPGTVSIVDYGDVLSPKGVFHEYLDGVQVRSADGIHTPAYAPGNVFAGTASKAVADAFYDWLSPRIWPLIMATEPRSPGRSASR